MSVRSFLYQHSLTWGYVGTGLRFRTPYLTFGVIGFLVVSYLILKAVTPCLGSAQVAYLATWRSLDDRAVSTSFYRLAIAISQLPFRRPLPQSPAYHLSYCALSPDNPCQLAVSQPAVRLLTTVSATPSLACGGAPPYC